uniref:Zn(II)Cys5 transcription factor n=1 Tax=Curvularia sp. IFB-Z10 TaxID=1526222 RepID=A0A6B9PP11_9PLEO|nr:Zn(II)Cys5 transcription factor [Curvularia sp. IFB-Z10]
MPPPTGIRLRDSCQSCAASKTRCSKEKPQCARCAKRGTKCEYLVTQRTGRKALSQRDSDSKDNNDAASRRASLKRTMTESTVQSSDCRELQEAGPDMYMLDSSLKTLKAEMLPETTIQDDYFSMLLSDLDFPAIGQAYGTDAAGAVSEIPAPQSLLAGISHETVYPGCPQANTTSASEFLCPEERQREFSLLPGHHHSSLCMHAQDSEQTGFPNPASCAELPFQDQLMHKTPQQQEGLRMALQLMQHLCFLDDRSAVTIGPMPFAPDEQRIGALIDKSSKVTATISAMLQCDSSQDGYFLAVVCLAMSKVLDAYVTASQTLSPLHDRRRLSRSSSSSSSLSSLSPLASSEPARSRSTGSASPPASQGDPKAVQHLLDELYLVRASMDLLGAKIAAMPPLSCDALAAALPFSAETLNQLYDEQRRRLKAISLHLINTLKAFWVEEMSF